MVLKRCEVGGDGTGKLARSGEEVLVDHTLELFKLGPVIERKGPRPIGRDNGFDTTGGGRGGGCGERGKSIGVAVSRGGDGFVQLDVCGFLFAAGIGIAAMVQTGERCDGGVVCLNGGSVFENRGIMLRVVGEPASAVDLCRGRRAFHGGIDP